jgi:RND superfamily putative drug exporter
VIRFADLADRLRWPIVLVWIGLVVLAAVAIRGLPELLSNRFDLPNTEATAVLEALERDYGQRGDSSFVLIARTDDGTPPTPTTVEAVQSAAASAGRALGPHRNAPAQVAGDLVYVAIGSTLEPVQAQRRVGAMRDALPAIEGATLYLTGQTAINRDLQPVVDRDLIRGEAIAIPIAIAVLLFVFGTLLSTFAPLVFALATVPTTLGLVWIAAHWIDMPIYVVNLVTLIGIGIAIDYSLLIVYRFREEMLRRQEASRPPGDTRAARHLPLSREEIRAALRVTMVFAGHAVVFSGLTVAIGLAGLLLLPLPFIRSVGFGGLVIPLISIVAAITLLPALLSLLGTRLGHIRVVPERVLQQRMDADTGFWVRLSRGIMRRPWPFLVVGTALLLALAFPALRISLTPGSNAGLPAGVESVDGLRLLEATVGPGPLSPSQILVETDRDDGIWQPAELEAIARLAAALRADPAIGAGPDAVTAVSDLPGVTDDPAVRAQAVELGLVNARGSSALLLAAGREPYDTPEGQEFARRIRDTLIPAAAFPAQTTVLAGGGPGAGIDFIDRAYGSFPYLIGAVLLVTFLLLIRAFRSLLLPLKAVILNVLGVSAAYGILVLVFQEGWGAWAGLQPTGQIEAWIPIFLFAMLFGLSMDYEVFLVTRMRELYDEGYGNMDAVAIGLERTGRIVTAAAIILCAAFAGFLFGSVSALQQFGLGLAAGILIDATLIRMILVPAFMRVAGGANWWLPASVARLVRVRPSPMRREGEGARPTVR